MLIKAKGKESWTSFYRGPSKTIYIDTKTQQNPSGRYIYVAQSFFTSFSVSYTGGCIKVEDNSIDVLLEESYFTNISSSTWGLAVSFNVRNVVYNKICGVDCKATTPNYSEIFDRAQTPDNIDNMNHANLSSFASIKDLGQSIWILSRRYGQIILESTNVSFNECTRCSALGCYLSYRSGVISSLISFCSFSNNSATSYNMILFDSNNQYIKNKIEACNIINNKQKTNDKGLISSESELIINDTCILNNDATLIVSVYNSYSMTIMNSYSDHPSYKTGIVAFETWAEDIFINAIVMFNTGKCIASFDSFGSITATEKRKRKSHCYKSACSCEKSGLLNRSTRFILCILMIQMRPSNCF